MNRHPRLLAREQRARRRRARRRILGAALPSAAQVITLSSHALSTVTDSDPEILRLIRDLAAIGWHSHYADYPGLPPDAAVAADDSEFTHQALLVGLDRHLRHRLSHRQRRRVKVHTEPLAMVIDRLVCLAITHNVLAVAGDSHSGVRELDTALADLALGYDQLVADLVTGRRRQPRFAISRAI
ncbi:DUF4254 domain-containing protein [Nocardia ninae]|uniref:DUF4254 domain-containing protein n=1 Tax=Nocardia ninae NBRC 108245 TaxID=1210091 RepID=A0A511ME08_9NOCA|nr:DUF4254 domain-containing protein [Nocardia ninae]GEM38862.1 hypothetical protein NN4_33810 [Nocardia ninae NBRC 108245]